MFINWKLREINLKIVYYGPSLSGKTSSLEYIHSRTHPDRRGELISLKTREDRTLYFDYMQFQMGEISGLKHRFNIYTVPGQVYYRGTRKLVLKGVDGIVFVADSQINRLEEKVKQRGYTLVPTRMYMKHHRAKLEFALARGKRKYDKRQELAKKDAQREMERTLSRKNR